MSVENRRLAAAQRTAVGARKSRALRLASWFLIVPTLALFSFSVIAGAAGFGGKPNYVKAVESVRPDSPGRKSDSPERKSENRGKDDGAYVVVPASDTSNQLLRAFARDEGREVCWITSSQLTRVSRVYATGRLSITVSGRSLDLVTVKDASERDLRGLLGGHLTCRLVQVANSFFLPFDAHGS